MKPKNFVYFHVHDLGRHLPVYGVPVEAPNLAAFAAEAVVFDSAFCSSPACTPSRACALSGRHAHTTGCIGLSHMGWPLHLREATIVDDLNNAGYETALVGVNHERHPRTDRYQVDMTEHWDDWGTAKAVDKALAYLKSRDRSSAPLFLNVGSQQPHASTWHQFEDSADPPPRTWVPLWMQDSAPLRADMGRFQAAIRYMDHHFGRLMAGLKELGYADDTVVVFTTDHGISGPRAKGFLYDRGLEIALMIRMPGAAHAGQRRSQLIANIDFRPTWLELLVLPVPAPVQGKSFAAAITDPAWTCQQAIFAERNFHGEKVPADAPDFTDLYDPIRSIRTRDFHYIRNFNPGLRPAEPLPFPQVGTPARPVHELYDLRHDPQELISVAGRPEYAGIVTDLSSQLEEWMRQTGDFALEGTVPARPQEPGWGPNWFQA